MKSIGIGSLLVGALLVSGCLSVGRLSDLPTSFEQVKFNEVNKSEYGHYEYDFVLVNVTDEQIHIRARKALEANGYSVQTNDMKSRIITGERGLRLNTWGSVAGVYSRRNGDQLDVKVIVRITQDFTGTLPENFAEDIASEIKKPL
jgi:hypothetical protein